MTTTNLVWENNAPTVEDQQAMANQLTVMQSQGKTDGVPVITAETPLPTQYTVARTWIDNASAEEWINFCLPYNPVSAQIVG